MILVDKLEGFKIAEAFFGKELDRDTRQIRRYKVQLKKDGLIEYSTRPRHKYEPCRYYLTDLGRKLLPDIFTRYKNLTFYNIHITPFVKDETEAQKNVLPNSYLVEKEFKKGREGKEGVTGAQAPTRGNVTKRKEEHSKSVSKRKESSMELPEIPVYVQELTKKLDLTLAGQLKLMSFTQSAVEHGTAQLKHMKSSKDIFQSLVEECVNWSKQNNHPVNWQTPFLRAADAGLVNKKGPFSNGSITSVGGSSTPSKPHTSSPEILKQYREKMQGVQRAWEAKKRKENPDDPLVEGKEAIGAIMTNLGVSPEIIQEVQETATVTPVPQARRFTTQEHLNFISHRTEAIRQFESLGKLNPFQQILYDSFKREVEEDLAQQAKEPEWTFEELQLIDWVTDYIAARTVTQTAWQWLVDEIALGPSSPRALSGELMEGCRLMKRLMTESEVRIDSASKEEPVELVDEDQAFNEV